MAARHPREQQRAQAAKHVGQSRAATERGDAKIVQADSGVASCSGSRDAERNVPSSSTLPPPSASNARLRRESPGTHVRGRSGSRPGVSISVHGNPSSADRIERGCRSRERLKASGAHADREIRLTSSRIAATNGRAPSALNLTMPTFSPSVRRCGRRLSMSTHGPGARSPSSPRHPSPDRPFRIGHKQRVLVAGGQEIEAASPDETTHRNSSPRIPAQAPAVPARANTGCWSRESGCSRRIGREVHRRRVHCRHRSRRRP